VTCGFGNILKCRSELGHLWAVWKTKHSEHSEQNFMIKSVFKIPIVSNMSVLSVTLIIVEFLNLQLTSLYMKTNQLYIIILESTIFYFTCTIFEARVVGSIQISSRNCIYVHECCSITPNNLLALSKVFISGVICRYKARCWIVMENLELYQNYSYVSF